MIDLEKDIQGLEFTKEMILFNPSTGEVKEPENLNDLDKITYDACVGAIALLKEQEKTIENLKEIIKNADESLESIKEKINEMLYEDFRRVK